MFAPGRSMLFALALVAASCAPSQRPAVGPEPAAESPKPGVLKRVSLAILGDPPQLYNSIGGANATDDVVEEL